MPIRFTTTPPFVESANFTDQERALAEQIRRLPAMARQVDELYKVAARINERAGRPASGPVYDQLTAVYAKLFEADQNIRQLDRLVRDALAQLAEGGVVRQRRDGTWEDANGLQGLASSIIGIGAAVALVVAAFLIAGPHGAAVAVIFAATVVLLSSASDSLSQLATQTGGAVQAAAPGLIGLGITAIVGLWLFRRKRRGAA